MVGRNERVILVLISKALFCWHSMFTFLKKIASLKVVSLDSVILLFFFFFFLGHLILGACFLLCLHYQEDGIPSFPLSCCLLQAATCAHSKSLLFNSQCQYLDTTGLRTLLHLSPIRVRDWFWQYIRLVDLLFSYSYDITISSLPSISSWLAMEWAPSCFCFFWQQSSPNLYAEIKLKFPVS